MSDLTTLFDELFTDLFYVPYGNIKRTEPEAIHMELELPGVKRDEIKVSIEDGYLRVRVDSKRKKGSRVISLSKYHNTDEAEVKYEDGLLTIDVPIKKPDKKDQKVLEIK